MNRNELIATCRSFERTHGVDSTQYYLTCGGVLALMGIKNGTNDIDATMTVEDFNDFTERFPNKERFYYPPLNVHCNEAKGVIAAGIELHEQIGSPPTLMWIDGIQCETLDSIARFKLRMGREKDLADCKLIADFTQRKMKCDAELVDHMVQYLYTVFDPDEEGGFPSHYFLDNGNILIVAHEILENGAKDILVTLDDVFDERYCDLVSCEVESAIKRCVKKHLSK